MKQLPLYLLILILPGCQYESLNWEQVNAGIQQQYPDIKHISINDFMAIRDTDTLLIDVREPEEYAISHISGAQNISDAAAIVGLALQTQKNIVVYCSIGYRSAVMAQKLKKRGIHNVTNLQGSIFAWANADLPLVNKAGSTLAVHPYDDYWGQLLDKTTSTH